jgi:hypothetical protein
MKTCSVCQTANADGNRFCQQCGRPLDVAPPHEATVRWAGQPMPIRLPHRATGIDTLFGDKDRLVSTR